MSNFLIAIFVLAICTSCALSISSQQTNHSQNTQGASSVPDGWIVYPNQEIGSSTLQCANHARREWRVEQGENNVKIRLDTLSDHQAALPDVIRFRDAEVGTKGYRSVQEVPDGWLIGLDVGEFGGGLWWFSSDGKSKEKLSAENIIGFTKTSIGVFAFTGLAHLSNDNGEVVKIVGVKNAPRKIETLVNLGSAPRAFITESNDSFLILTTKSLVRVKLSGTMVKILSTRYGQLYPNSMVVSPSGIIYIGMRHFVTRLTPTSDGYLEEWLVPNGCRRFKEHNFDCVCMS
jgi:hypothetical protein